MTTDRNLDLPLDLIDIPDNRARALNMDWGAGLADMIRVQGLLMPITVRHVGDRYRLVSGRHRLAAFERLGSKDMRFRKAKGGLGGSPSSSRRRRLMRPVRISSIVAMPGKS